MTRLFILTLFLLSGISLSYAQQSGPAAQHPNVQTLINTDKVYGVPASGALPNELTALHFVFSMPDAPFELIKIYRYGSPAGKVYALMGLKALNSQHFNTFKTDFIRRGQGSIRFFMPGSSESSRDAVQFIQQWETDFDQQASYTKVKP